jgi:hypothetical protein
MAVCFNHLFAGSAVEMWLGSDLLILESQEDITNILIYAFTRTNVLHSDSWKPQYHLCLLDYL